MKQKSREEKYTEVWGDTVVLKELVYACIIGIILTMSMFLLGKYLFHKIPSIEKSLASGYALLIGVMGCILSGVISAKLFKPKRNVEEKFELENIEALLEKAGLTLSEEGEYLGNADEEIIRELENLELYPLLALIPKGSKNYKSIYCEKVKEKEA